MMLAIRKLADATGERRVKRYDPLTGDSMLINPATTDPDDLGELAAGNWKHEPWPLLGIEIEGDTPKICKVPAAWVLKGRREGWLQIEDESVAHRPGGPPEDLWRVTHTFIHGSTIVLKCLSGDVRYRITRLPDKYVEDGKDTDKVTDAIYAAGATDVDWTYTLKLED